MILPARGAVLAIVLIAACDWIPPANPSPGQQSPSWDRRMRERACLAKVDAMTSVFGAPTDNVRLGEGAVLVWRNQSVTTTIVYSGDFWTCYSYINAPGLGGVSRNGGWGSWVTPPKQ